MSQKKSKKERDLMHIKCKFVTADITSFMLPHGPKVVTTTTTPPAACPQDDEDAASPGVSQRWRLRHQLGVHKVMTVSLTSGP